MFERHRNPGSEPPTYNGVALFAEITGLSPEEIRWTFDRTKALKSAGKSKPETLAIIRQEAQGKPWLSPASS